MEEHQLIENIACRICERGMEAPAIFALEMYKPLAGVIYNFSLAIYPVLNAVAGLDKVKDISAIMRSSDSIEKLILLLENKVLERKAAKCRE